MPESVPAEVKWQRQNQHHNSHVIYRFRGYFHEPAKSPAASRSNSANSRCPRETHPSVAHPPQFLLAVDGRPITDGEAGQAGRRSEPAARHPPLRDLGHRLGLHHRLRQRSVKLQANLDDPEKLVDCPDSFFDPATFPEGVLDHRNGPATITANDDGTEFKVKFAPDSRARLLKLVFLDQEGPVPALNKLDPHRARRQDDPAGGRGLRRAQQERHAGNPHRRQDLGALRR